jgi:uncharacterized membrane protein
MSGFATMDAGIRPRSAAVVLVCLASCGSAGDGPADTGGVCPSNLPSGANCSTATPSYSSKIAPIVSNRCLSCHFAGNTISGISLADQGSVYTYRSIALTQVYQCKMPPAGAESLTAAERDLLILYLVCNAPDN